MNIASKIIEKYQWFNIIIFTNFLLMFRLLLNPLLLIFNGTIYWIYVFQIINGLNFGLNWPATTYGLNSNLDEDQKSLGMTFFSSIRLAGNLAGNLLGSLLAFLIPNEDNFYYALYILAAFFFLMSSLILFYRMKKYH
jgi:MFS family permease